MIASDARVLWQLLRGHPQSGDHAADLAGFYGTQAEAYDSFRERLLPGRDQLFAHLATLLPERARLVELGAGTGRNLAWLGDGVTGLAHVDLVDLCPPLLEQAHRRWQHQPQVQCHHADACRWQPHSPADAVVFAYSLTMIPDWQGALANALAMLKPGGYLAVVDFTLSPQQSRLACAFWRRWFAHDGVHLNAAHLASLQASLPTHWCYSERTRLPYLPGLRLPYYSFIGRKD